MYSLYYGDSFVFETPERTGYTFLGWYDGNEKLKGTVWKFTEDKTFKAKWQINQYQFAADCDQAKGQVSGTSLGTYDYGTEISVSAIP
ncbi:MAG: hypothetical protein SOT34_00535 [Candidatus Borkfalkiaceae bacterium]|nr:hypothetical protein [Christensenellaceae bacterium]